MIIDRGNSPEIVKYAGEYMYNQYFNGVRSVIRKRKKKSPLISVDDISHTWFCLMLDKVKRLWNHSKCTVEEFIHSRWYYAIYESFWVANGYNSRTHKRTSVDCIRFEELEEHGIYGYIGPEVYDDHSKVEWEEEFSFILKGIPSPYIDIFKDCFYNGLEFSEIDKKYHLGGIYRARQWYLDSEMLVGAAYLMHIPEDPIAGGMSDYKASELCKAYLRLSSL